MLGIAFGLVIGQLEFVRQITAPALNFFRAMPPASIVPIVIIAMGVGPAPKIFIIAMTCFWPILLNTIDGVRGTAPAVRDTALRRSPMATAGRRARPGRAQIRHVIEMSSETAGKQPETFRYSWTRPMGNLLNSPRFSKGTRELL